MTAAAPTEIIAPSARTANGPCHVVEDVFIFVRPGAVLSGPEQSHAAAFAEGSPIPWRRVRQRAARCGSKLATWTLCAAPACATSSAARVPAKHAGRKQDTGMGDTRSPRAAQPRTARRLTLAAAAARVRVEATITWTRAGWPAGAAPLLERLAAAVRSLDDGRGTR
jgi:hypothetical protein